MAGGFVVRDANGVRVAYVYADTNQMGSASDTEKLSLEEAGKIARGISRLPDLMARK